MLDNDQDGLIAASDLSGMLVSLGKTGTFVMF